MAMGYANPGMMYPQGGGAYSTPASGQPGWASDIGAGLNLAGSLYGLYQAGHLQGAAQDVFRQSDPFAGYRPGYGADLLKLMQDPSSVSKLPGYQFLLGQGVQAIDRSAAGPGGSGFGSGQMNADLMKYGQGLADQFYQQQVQTLSGLAGSGISPANPADALRGLGGAAGSMGSSIAGLGGALPGTINMLNRLFPGGAGMGGGAGISGIDQTSMMDQGMYDLYAGGTPISDPTYQSAMGMMGPSSGFGGGTPMDLSASIGDWGTAASPGIAYDAGATGGSLDISGMFGGPKAAGGVAATSGGYTGNALQTGGNMMGIGLGLASGTPTGYLSAATSGAALASRYPGLSAETSRGLGLGGAAGANVLGIIQGLRTGGVSGYGQAGISGAGLAAKGLGASGAISSGAASEIGAVAGYAAVPLSVYNFAKNWQGGAVGSDALQGAETGAAIGSVIPGVGTAVGALAGGVIGGLSGLMGNAGSREAAPSHAINAAIDKLPSAQQVPVAATMPAATATKYIQSLMSAENNKPGHSTGLEMAFGRLGVDNFTKQMNTQLSSAAASGRIRPGMSPAQIYQSIVAPWLASKGASLSVGAIDSKGNNFTNALTGAVQALISNWMSGG